MDNCWRCCSSAPVREPLGLCSDCEEELRAELPHPANPNWRLLAPGHLPEGLPKAEPYRAY